MFQKEKIVLTTNEKKLFIINHHGIVIFSHLLFTFLLAVVDFFLLYYLFMQGFWGVGVFFLVLFFSAFYFWRVIFLWKRNYVLITNKRIIDFEQVGFWEKYQNEFLLDDLVSVEVEKTGLLSKILRYGNLKFKFIDEDIPFEIYKVVNPDFWQEKIIELIKVDSVGGFTSAVDLLYDEICRLDKKERDLLFNKFKNREQEDDDL